MTLFRRLALATTLTTLGVITVGGLVRATGSGDGCPNWPKCFGRWLPPAEYHAIIEWSHRAIGAVAIALLCVTLLVAIVKHRRERRILIPTLLATPGIFMQAILGAVVVAAKTRADYSRFEASLVTGHIATAMMLVGVLVYVTVTAYKLDGRVPVAEPAARIRRLAMLSAASVFGLILIGAYVRGSHAGLVFADWPLMNGTVVPALGGLATTHLLHRAAALIVGIVVAVFVWRARTGPAKHFARAAGALFLAQVFVGGLQVWTKLAWPPVVAHVALSALIWSCLVAAATLTPKRMREAAAASDAEPGRARSLAATLKAYVALTKPRIVVLLVVTTVPTMMLAARGMPPVMLVVWTVVGGTLAAGGANAINMYLDRDIDTVMVRTRNRPLPAHAIEPGPALLFAMSLAVASFVLMSIEVNVLAAVLTQAAVVFYVFVYTIGLKRTTPQNIVIGGAAGAVPVLVGWAAVTGTVATPAYLLFAVVFLWTPPHFWALAMRFSKDYAAAGVPMMPVVAGARSTQRQIVLYTLATVGVTIALYPAARMGELYLGAALVLGALFVRRALDLLRNGSADAAYRLFRYSIVYLAALFAAVGIDAGIGRVV